MRIFLFTLGTRGDLELFLTLGRALRRRGHRVVVGTSGFYTAAVARAGLELAPVGSGTAERLRSVLAGLRGVSGPVDRTRAFYRQWVAPELESGRYALTLLADRADAFVSNLQMVLRRGNAIVPGAVVTYDLPVDAGAPQVPAHGPGVVHLVALSRPLVDPAGTWDPECRFTGFWSAPAAGWRPSAALQALFDAGPPPVVVTMGSMLGVDLGGLVDRLGRALHRCGQRGVVVLGWAQPPAVNPALPVRLVREAPYDWLFSRACAVVHTGSYGATAAALRAGKMSVVLPQLAAQQRMGECLVRAGAAAGVFGTEDIAEEALAEALHRAATGDGAARWRTLVAGEPGVEAAAELIETQAAGEVAAHAR